MFWTHRHQGVPLSRIELLRAVPMFAELPDDLLVKVDSLVSEISVAAGTKLMVQDEQGREAFIIAEGVAQVITAGELVAEVGPGALVGEMSLLDNQPRSATVVAKTPLRILVMEPRQFGALFSDPHAAQWIAASLSKRLRDNAARNESRAPAVHRTAAE